MSLSSFAIERCTTSRYKQGWWYDRNSGSNKSEKFQGHRANFKSLNRGKFRLFSNYQLNAHFLYSLTICMLRYNPQHVSSSTLLIFKRVNCIITASGIVTLYKRPYSTPVESGLFCSPLSTGVLYGCLQRVTIPEAVIIRFTLLKMSKVPLETCWGL